MPLGEKAAAVARRSETIVTPISLGANNWVQLGPTVIPNGQTSSAASGGSRVNVTGRITEIVVDPTSPSTMYVATAGGGVWKTVDGGVTWSPKSDKEVSLAIGALAMAPSDSNRLYAGTGEGNIFYYVQNFPLQLSNDDYYDHIRNAVAQKGAEAVIAPGAQASASAPGAASSRSKCWVKLRFCGPSGACAAAARTSAYALRAGLLTTTR
jgi:hypothetical protein